MSGIPQLPESSATNTHRRQMLLLQEIAKRCDHLTDRGTSLFDIAPGIELQLNRFIATKTTSELIASDLNAFATQELILVRDTNITRESFVREKTRGPLLLVVTQSGLDTVREFEEAERESKRSRIAKSIEHQPWTFVGVLVTIGLFFWGTVINNKVNDQKRQIDDLQKQLDQKAPVAVTAPATHP